MTRRDIITALGALVVLPMKGASALRPQPDPGWRVKVVVPGGPFANIARGRVFDLATGKDVSMRFPIGIAHRLHRSWLTQRNVRVSLFRLNDKGKPYLAGEHIAREMATVRVAAIEAA